MAAPLGPCNGLACWLAGWLAMRVLLIGTAYSRDGLGGASLPAWPPAPYLVATVAATVEPLNMANTLREELEQRMRLGQTGNWRNGWMDE